MKNLPVLCTLFVFLFSCGSEDPIDDIINNQTILIESDITEETIFEDIIDDPAVADYIVRGYLDIDALLTIDPGVVIAFEANAVFFVAGINTTGVLKAIGTAAEPIVFTGVEKSPGFWRGISIQSKDVRNELTHTILEYAGSDFLVQYASVDVKGGLALNSQSGGFDGGVKLKNSVIRQCLGYGFIVEQFTTIREFSSNTFSDNEKAAVRINANNAGMLDAESNYAGKNGLEGVEINASGSPTHRLTLDATWPALKGGAMYFVEQGFDAEAKLTLMPGVTLAFQANQGITFEQDQFGNKDGILVANGSSTNPITFTAIDKTPGYWSGLQVQSNSVLNSLDYCIIEYGGSDNISSDKAGNLALDKNGAFDAPALSVTNCTIRNSSGCGIIVDTFGGNLTESDNTFSNNADGNICM